MKTIFNPEISKQVYEDYPVTKKEKRCAAEREKREGLRFERAKRYITATMQVTEEKWEKDEQK